MHARPTIAACVVVLVAHVALASARAEAPAGPSAAPSLALPAQELRVATKHLRPFAFRDGDTWTGFSIELWDAVARHLGLRYTWVETRDVGALLAAVAPAGDCDVAIAGISMTRARELTVDFSYPFFESGLQVMTSTEGGTSSFVADTLLPLLFQVGSAGVLILLAVAHLIWLAERRRNRDQFPARYLPGIWAGFWWSAVTLTTVGYGDAVPRSRLGRLIALIWMFSGIILISFFTASVTTGLTIERLEGPIQGPHDLAGHRVGTVAGSTAERWLTTGRHDAVAFETIDAATRALQKHNVAAIVYDAPVLLHTLRQGAAGGNLAVVGPLFERQSYAVALREGSPLREAVNRALLRLREDGTYQMLHQRWFGPDE
jgi:polar amino acid transport system substrate-binding protein